MNGNSSTPTNAVNSSSTATSLCLKYRSTRYLSKCVEIAQRTGPENAKNSQDIVLLLPLSCIICGGGKSAAGVINDVARTVDPFHGYSTSDTGFSVDAGNARCGG